jgi:rod shape determining protein RodA
MFKKGLLYFDLGLLLPIFILLLVNLATLFSLNLSLFKSELLYVAFGLIVFFGFSFVNHKVAFLYGKSIYIISLILLVAVLVMGVEARGSLRWIEIYGFRIQFAELLKPFLAISLSSFLLSKNSISARNFISILCFILPVVLLVFVQPDLGDALIYAFVALAALIFYGFSWFYVFGLFLISLLVAPIGWLFLHDYQKQRIMTFLSPASDPLGKSYNAIQSVIAIGAGMFLGKGFGQGSQSGLRFLPERHTDFIFATITEQLGFIGSALVIVCFLFLLYRIYRISQNSSDKSSKLFSMICFFIILVQFFLNVGMNIGILPIVGVTLPFLSYGGSSMLTNFIIIGLLTSIARSTTNNKVLEIG